MPAEVPPETDGPPAAFGCIAGDPFAGEPDPAARGRSVAPDGGGGAFCAIAGATARAVATRQVAMGLFSMHHLLEHIGLRTAPMGACVQRHVGVHVPTDGRGEGSDPPARGRPELRTNFPKTSLHLRLRTARQASATGSANRDPADASSRPCGGSQTREAEPRNSGRFRTRERAYTALTPDRHWRTTRICPVGRLGVVRRSRGPAGGLQHDLRDLGAPCDPGDPGHRVRHVEKPAVAGSKYDLPSGQAPDLRTGYGLARGDLRSCEPVATGQRFRGADLVTNHRRRCTGQYERGARQSREHCGCAKHLGSSPGFQQRLAYQRGIYSPVPGAPE